MSPPPPPSPSSEPIAITSTLPPLEPSASSSMSSLSHTQALASSSSSTAKATTTAATAQTTQLPEPSGGAKIQFVGFAAGIASGWTKLIVGHPFDTIKTRLQCSPPNTYSSSLDCLLRTIRSEGPLKLYAGALAPFFGWSMTDAVLMGSLTNYREWLRGFGLGEVGAGVGGENGGGVRGWLVERDGEGGGSTLAGWTNAPIAHPIETIKSKLQLQFSRDALKLQSSTSSNPNSSSGSASSLPKPAARPTPTPAYMSALSAATGGIASSPTRPFSASALSVPKGIVEERFTGPIDVIEQTVKHQGVRGMWRGYGATVIYRSNMGWLFGCFELFNRQFAKLEGTKWEVSKGTGNFLAGGMASNAYWLAALPADNIKNRLMADNIRQPRYRGIYHVFHTILHERDVVGAGGVRNFGRGLRNFYKGVVPVVLRAFPTNAAALFVWESIMRSQKA